MRLSQSALKTPTANPIGSVNCDRIGAAIRSIRFASVLAAMIAWPFLYRPSWRWDLVASVLYLAGSALLLSAFFRGIHTDPTLDS